MIKQLFSVVTLAVLFSLNAGAQIRYHDIVPDTIVGSPSGAGQVSTFTWNAPNSSSLQLVWNNVPGIGALAHPGIEVLCGAGGDPDKLEPGAPISSASACWYENTLKPLSQDGAGNWQANGDNRYLGFRFRVAGGAHYGWMRLSVTSSGALVCTVKDWAYNEALNQPIQAGQTSNTTSIGLTDNKNKVQLLQEGRSVRWLNLDRGHPYALVVTTLQGSLAGRIEVRAEQSVTLPDLAPGIYILTLYGTAESSRFKILLR